MDDEIEQNIHFPRHEAPAQIIKKSISHCARNPQETSKCRTELPWKLLENIGRKASLGVIPLLVVSGLPPHYRSVQYCTVVFCRPTHSLSKTFSIYAHWSLIALSSLLRSGLEIISVLRSCVEQLTTVMCFPETIPLLSLNYSPTEDCTVVVNTFFKGMRS